jgi:hypothetical protein
MHYGDEAMDDPSLKARHQAIEAEARPTLGGAVAARMATVVAAQAAAQLVGSENNLLNKIGKKHKIEPLKRFGVDGFTESVGEKLGGALPMKLQEKYNNFATRNHLTWSEAQIKAGKTGTYTNATQDLGRFIAADTFYTMVTALTIGPVVKFLQYIPGMSYKPKMAKGTAVFDADGERIKVPANHYTDTADMELTRSEPRELPNTPTTTVNSVEAHVAPSRESQTQAAIG